jgi:hypothetical protein
LRIEKLSCARAQTFGFFEGSDDMIQPLSIRIFRWTVFCLSALLSYVVLHAWALSSAVLMSLFLVMTIISLAPVVWKREYKSKDETAAALIQAPMRIRSRTENNFLYFLMLAFMGMFAGVSIIVATQAGVG